MIHRHQLPSVALFSIALLFVSNSSTGQNSPYLQPPTSLTGNFSSGTQNITTFNAELSNVTVNNAANYEVRARQYIHMGPGNEVSALTSGQFHAYIEDSPLDVVSYYPSATGFDNVAVYDKFELGIKLPAAITKKVDDFFGKYKITNNNNGYGCEYNQGRNYINPYDPDQVSVEATFSFPERPPQTVYGFYYREYFYTTGSATPTYATDWFENLELAYHWRVRFAPKEVGTYTVTWIVRENGAIIARDDIGQSFTTIPSASRGFVKLGQNNKFMVTQQNSKSPEHTILPIGLVNANPKVAGTAADDPVPLTDCLPWGSGDLEFPSRYWRHREMIRTRIADQGGNLVRMMYKPYSYDIEWEHLGIYDNYQERPIQNGLTVAQAITAGFSFTGGITNPSRYKGTSRQAVMWEFDRLLDMAKKNNTYIQLCVETEENGFNTDQGGSWTKSPYFISALGPSPDPHSLIQFFTDPNAKAAYKKKLRYMIARYGYSSNIADFELFNEYHFLQKDMGGGNAIDVYFKPWLDEMMTYIKGPSGLNHRDHLFTASYQDGNGGDQVGDLPGLDFLSTHPYTWNLDVSFFAAYNDVKFYRNRHKKPCQAGEMGIQADWGCFNTMFPEFMTPTIHSLLWSTTFISGVTSGLDMWGHIGLDIDPATPTHPCGDGIIPHFKPLQAFIKNIEFDQDNYVPMYFKSEPVEAFYLIDNDGHNAANALGYVRNRTFWWANFSNPGSPMYDPNLTAEYQASLKSNCLPPVVLPSNQPVLTGWLSNVLIDGLNKNTLYGVDWYNTYIDPAVQNPIISSSFVYSNGNGKAYLSPPEFGDCEHQEYGFKLYDAGFPQKGGSALQPSSTGTSVYPNPASDKIHFRSNGKQIKNLVMKLYDLTGRLIATQKDSNELNIPKVASGIYVIKILGDDFTEAFKIRIEQ